MDALLDRFEDQITQHIAAATATGATTATGAAIAIAIAIATTTATASRALAQVPANLLPPVFLLLLLLVLPLVLLPVTSSMAYIAPQPPGQVLAQADVRTVAPVVLVRIAILEMEALGIRPAVPAPLFGDRHVSTELCVAVPHGATAHEQRHSRVNCQLPP